MKKITAYYFILMILLMIPFTISNSHHSNGIKLRCAAEILTRQKIDNTRTIYTHSELHYIFEANGKGSLTIYGSADENSTTYLLNRTLYFSYSNIDSSDIYEVRFHSEVINKTDNTPEQLADNLSFNTKQNNVAYLRLSKINEKLIILNRLSTPMTMCKKF